MSSNADSGFVPRNENGHHPQSQHASYFHNNDNNAFAGFDPALAGDQHDALQFADNHDWSYQPEQLGLSHTHDPQASLYQGWHNPSHQQHNLSMQPNGFNDFYNHSYQQNVQQQQQQQNPEPPKNTHYDGSNDFRYPMPSPYGLSTPYSADLNNNAFQPSAYSVDDTPMNTISPGALQSRPSSYPQQSMPPPVKQEEIKPKREVSPRDTPQAQIQLPKGAANGKFVIITSESLTSVISCRRYHNFLHVGDQTLDVPITKTTIPAYIPRKSRNEIQKLLANDSALTAKLSKKPKRGSIIPAPRAAFGRSETPTTNKARLSKTETTPSSEEPESSDDESDDEEEESMHPPLPATRPTKALEAVKYDTIKTLWRVPYRSVEVDDIRKGLSEFWEIIRTIRDRWKSDTLTAKAAEDAKKVNEIPLLKERVENQRDLLEVVLGAAVAEGHRDIVEHLGENVPLVLALAQFLQDRIRETDYNGTLSRAILKLLARCITLTDGTLEKTGIAKFLPRFQKRANEEMQGLAKRIIDNASAASKKRKDGSRPVSASKESSTAPKAASPVAGVKRMRPGESGNDQPLKKVASNQGVTKTAATVKRPEADGKSTATANAAIVKKPAVPTKTSSFFSTLQSAKRPSAKQTAVTAPPPKPAAEKLAATPVNGNNAAKTAGFSFADAMASLNKPKEPEPVVNKREEEATGPPESVEERTKRLRKEHRRKLRVSWKPDIALEEIREFIHEPEEEYGFDANQVRDARDKDSEGRMFKLGSHQDMMDIDDEDEPELPPSELDDHSKPFPEPTTVDFSRIPQEERDKLFMPYGGGSLQPNSPERAAQEQREANTLIAVYADRSDIPATPKEPPESNEEYKEPKPFGRPFDVVLERLAMFNMPIQPIMPAIPTDLAAFLGSLAQPPPMSQQPFPTAQPTTSNPDLDAIFAQFRTPHPQAPIQQQPQVPNMASLFASFAPPQPQNAAAAYPPQQQAQSYPQPPPAIPENISAMLSALTSNNPNSNPNPANMPPLPGMPSMSANGMPDFTQMNQMAAQLGMPLFPAFPGMPGFPPMQNQQQQQQNTGNGGGGGGGNGGFENPERLRLMQNQGDGGSGGGQDDDDDYGGRSGGRGGGGGAGIPKWKQKGTEPPKFVVQCKYWKQGKCRKGDDCTFLHTET